MSSENSGSSVPSTSASPAGSPDAAAGLVNNLVASQPEPTGPLVPEPATPPAADATPAPSSLPTAPAAEEPIFDPSVHETGPDGKGIRRGRGFLRKLAESMPRRADGKFAPRQAGELKPTVNLDAPAPAPALTPGEPVAPGAPPTDKAGARQMGQMLTGVFVAMCCTWIDPEEWTPVPKAAHPAGVDEVEDMTAAAAEVAEKYGLAVDSAEGRLAMAVGQYAMPRLAKPKTRTRLRAVGDWIKARLGLGGKAAANGQQLPPMGESALAKAARVGG